MNHDKFTQICWIYSRIPAQVRRFRCHSATSYDASDEARDHSTQTRHCQRCVTALCILAKNWGYHGKTGRCHIRIPQYPSISISINIPHLLDPSGTSACYTCKTTTYLQPWLDVCLTICSKACCGAQEVRSGCQRGLRLPSGLGS